MSYSSELYALLKENYVHEFFFTHVSLIHPRGKYSLGRSVLSRFWTLYSKVIQANEVALGLAESPQPYSAVIVDVDLKFFIEFDPPAGNIYPQSFIDALIRIYQDVLREVVRDISEIQLHCVVLEKPKYRSSDHEQHYKNGFHLHFPWIFLSRVDQEIVILPRVRQRMAQNAHGLLDGFNALSSQLVNVKTVTDLIDAAAFKNAWLLYGSRKDEHQDTYRISRIVTADQRTLSVEEAFLSYVIYDEEEERIPLNTSNLHVHLPRILSIHPYGRAVSEVRTDVVSTSPELLQYVRKPVLAPVPEDTRDDDAVAEDLAVVKKILPFLGVHRADDRNNWMTVGWAIFNLSRGSDEGLDLWLTFSRRSHKYNEARCLYEWSHMEDRKRITLGTLVFFAKTDSPEAYQAYLFEQNRRALRFEFSMCHYDLAQILHRQHGTEFVYTDSGWYQFSNHHWQAIENGFELRSKISNDLVAFYKSYRDDMFVEMKGRDEDELSSMKKKEQELSRLIGCLKTTQFKQNIMRECQEVFHMRDFEAKLNTNRYLIGFRNGVYDLEENYFRVGLPTDYISLQMPIEYHEFEETDSRVREVHNFLEKVFPDSSLRRYFLDIMSETFVGYNHRKHVYYWTGEGDNGKSITQMFFEKMFGRLSIKAPTSMITSRRPNQGAANAELARAGNGVRTIFLEEPDPDEEIYTGVFKHLSGNDSIYTRDLFQKGKDVTEIVPMFKLFVICNKLPKIRKGGDKATWNRIRVIPFESTFSKNAPTSPEEQLRDKIFPVDTTLAQKIPSLVEPFAWILLQHRTRPKIDEPEKVIAATDRYRMNNDYLHQFIGQVIVDDEKGSVATGDLYCKYKEWLEESLPGVRPPPLLEFVEYFQKKWGDNDANGTWRGKRIRFERSGGRAGNDPTSIL
jgi:P4 family phage/plasmid primase-like protien